MPICGAMLGGVAESASSLHTHDQVLSFPFACEYYISVHACADVCVAWITKIHNSHNTPGSINRTCFTKE
jgi:hypothetical protein